MSFKYGDVLSDEPKLHTTTLSESSLFCHKLAWNYRSIHLNGFWVLLVRHTFPHFRQSSFHNKNKVCVRNSKSTIFNFSQTFYCIETNLKALLITTQVHSRSHNVDVGRYGRATLPQRHPPRHRFTSSIWGQPTRGHGDPRPLTLLFRNLRCINTKEFQVAVISNLKQKSHPHEHILAINIQMKIIGIHDSLKWKFFSETLKEATLRWYMNLPRFSMTSYKDLPSKLIYQLSASKH